jgi:hypothetical protein
MTARTDCRHLSTRTPRPDEVVHRCRLGAAQTVPFHCPEDCVFFEERPLNLGPYGGTGH